MDQARNASGHARFVINKAAPIKMSIKAKLWGVDVEERNKKAGLRIKPLRIKDILIVEDLNMSKINNKAKREKTPMSAGRRKDAVLSPTYSWTTWRTT